MLKGDFGVVVWGRQVVLMGLRDSLCSLFAYIWQPSVLIGLRDVSIRLNATLFSPEDCGVAPTLWSCPSALCNTPADAWSSELWYGKKRKKDAPIYGGCKCSRKPYGLRKLGSTCIFSICLEQLVVAGRSTQETAMTGIKFWKSTQSVALKIDPCDDS